MPRLPLHLASAIALAAAGLTVDAAAEPVLRGSIVVDGPAIRLGDLFADAGARADTIVATAPSPGGKAVYDAGWLAARAREQNLHWQPNSPYDQGVVERAS